MNLKKILFVTISFLQISVYAQKHGQAHYIKKSNHKFSSDGLYADIKKDIENFEYVLSFNDSLASYKEVKKGLNIENNVSSIAKVFSGYQGPYYYDFKSKNVFRKKGKYLINKDFGDYKWKLLKDKLVINNLNCYKASTQIQVETRHGPVIRDVTAWYTTDINVNVGPDGFTGLPGLIIQLEYQNVVTTLKHIDLGNKKISIKIPVKGQRISEKEFSNYMKDLMENRSEN